MSLLSIGLSAFHKKFCHVLQCNKLKANKIVQHAS